MLRLPPLLRSKGVLLALGTGALGGYGYRHAVSEDTAPASLDPYTFAPYTLTARDPVSATSSVFTLRNRSGADDAAAAERLKDVWRRCVWSVEVKQPQLQIARAYTPLPAVSANAGNADAEAEAQELRLLIRKEHKGEVSNYLHRLPVQSTIELRGPHVEFEIPERVREVLFLAGGTGIAPAMQVARVLEGREGARMRVLWANRLREECVGGRSDGGDVESAGWVEGMKRAVGLQRGGEEVAKPESGEKGAMVKELEALKRRSGEGLAVEYYVDEEGSFIRPADVTRQLQRPASANPEAQAGERLIMVSGPEGFLEYWAGRKVWGPEGEVQGPLRGALSRMDLKGWKVWKL